MADISADVHGSYYHQRPWGCPWSGAAAWDHIDVQGLCRTGPALQAEGLWRVSPISHWQQHLGSTVELALVVGAWVSWASGHDCGRADSTTSLLGGGVGAGVIASLYSPWNLRSQQSWPQRHESWSELTLPPEDSSIGLPSWNSSGELTLVVWIRES